MLCRILLLLLAPSLVACEQPTADDGIYYQTVNAMQVEPTDHYSTKRTFVGRTHAQQQTNVGFELPGKINEIFVSEGSQVLQGQELASQDTQLLGLEAKELAANLEETRARLQLARTSLKRQKNLISSGFSAAQRIDELDSDRKGLQATERRLEASIEANATRVRKARLLAPFDGVVSHRFVDQGAVVSAGAPVLTLLQTGAMEVQIGVPVRLADQLQPGQSYSVEINQRRGRATVSAVGANIEPASRTVPVWLLLEGIVARDGELASVDLLEHHRQAGFWVPIAAVTEGSARHVGSLWFAPRRAEPVQHRANLDRCALHTRQSLFCRGRP